MTFTTRFAAAICMGLTGALVYAPGAFALDAYWHGVRSSDWSDGKAGEASNWYELAPPNGNPTEVPDGTAFFAPGAQRKTAVVRVKKSIKKVDFTAGNDKYTIYVQNPGGLTVKGQGVANASGQEQMFEVDGKKTYLSFLDNAVAGIGVPANRITVINSNSGETRFRGTASASNAKITNEANGKVRFYDKASAGSAELINEQKNSEIHFEEKSTSTAAEISNLKGTVYFSQSKRKSVFVQKIDNRKKLIIGKSLVSIGDTLALSKKSTVSLIAKKKKTGRIDVTNKATLKGTLLVNGSPNVKPGRYTLISSKKNIGGRFNKPKLEGFGSKLKVSILYRGREVLLDVREK